jgi:hypothetical protein
MRDEFCGPTAQSSGSNQTANVIPFYSFDGAEIDTATEAMSQIP